jgi:hypothetical protein
MNNQETKELQIENLTEEFFRHLQNPTEMLIKDLLRNMKVFVWGSYVANSDILNTNQEPSLSQHDVSRMEEGEIEWLNEHALNWAEDCIDNNDTTIRQGEVSNQLYSSELFPVSDEALRLLESIFMTFDAFVMGTCVYRNSVFRGNIRHAYDYQSCMMSDWDDQFIEED